VTSMRISGRQLVHFAMGLFALALRFLTWWQAAGCALAAFLFNLFVLPRIGGRALYRPADVSRGYPLGILFYPLSVLLLVLAFPRRPDIAAAAWAILAAGDPMAAAVGGASRGSRLAWNPDKSAAGTAAFILAGSAAGVLLAWWTRPAVVHAPPLLFTFGAPVLAGIVAGFVESMPVRLDDNISVPIAAAIVLGGLALVDAASCQAAAGWLPRAFAVAAAVNLPVAAAGFLAGTVTVAGAIAGAAIGIVVFAFTGIAGWTLLFASFFVASVSSRLGLKRKAVLGIAEEREGRRGPGNAIANTSLGAFAAVLAVLSPHRDGALLAMVAALAASGSDTVASEIGKAWGRRTFLFPTLARVRPGTPGAISLEGTAAGLVAALGLAALAQPLGLVHGNAVWYAAAGATAGAFIESSLGATLEGPGIVNNDLLNFLNTASAVVVALALAWLMR
jgi:uncharacterized protein (TIGR00297 family)